MTDPTERLADSRNALLDFALIVMAWHEWPTDRSRQRLIEANRTAGATTGIPEAFEDFATALEHEQSRDGGETR